MKKCQGIPVTHKGWIFFVCPIYLSMDDPEEPVVVSRWKWLNWWFDVTLLAFDGMTAIATKIDPDIDPTYPILITGEV